jgi:ankyrin repeat protein
LEAGSLEENVNAFDERGATLIHYSALVGDVRTAEWLLEKNAKLRAVESWSGQNAIHWAAEQGHLEMSNGCLTREWISMPGTIKE